MNEIIENESTAESEHIIQEPEKNNINYPLNEIKPSQEPVTIEPKPEASFDDEYKPEKKKKVFKIFAIVLIVISVIANGALGYIAFSKNKQNKNLMTSIKNQEEEIAKKQATIDEQSAQIEANASASVATPAATPTTSSTTKKTTTTSAQEDVITPPAPPSD